MTLVIIEVLDLPVLQRQSMLIAPGGATQSTSCFLTLGPSGLDWGRVQPNPQMCP